MCVAGCPGEWGGLTVIMESVVLRFRKVMHAWCAGGGGRGRWGALWGNAGQKYKLIQRRRM